MSVRVCACDCPHPRLDQSDAAHTHTHRPWWTVSAAVVVTGGSETRPASVKSREGVVDVLITGRSKWK